MTEWHTTRWRRLVRFDGESTWVNIDAIDAVIPDPAAGSIMILTSGQRIHLHTPPDLTVDHIKDVLGEESRP